MLGWSQTQLAEAAGVSRERWSISSEAFEFLIVTT